MILLTKWIIWTLIWSLSVLMIFFSFILNALVIVSNTSFKQISNFLIHFYDLQFHYFTLIALLLENLQKIAIMLCLIFSNSQLLTALAGLSHAFFVFSRHLESHSVWRLFATQGVKIQCKIFAMSYISLGVFLLLQSFYFCCFHGCYQIIKLFLLIPFRMLLLGLSTFTFHF